MQYTYKIILNLFLFVLTIGSPFSAQSQTKTDEFIAIFNQGNLDDKIDVFSHLFNSLDRSFPDSNFYYINILQEEALKEDREDALAYSNYYFANYLLNKSLFDEVVAKLDLARSYFEYENNDTTLAEVYNTYGNVNYLQGNYKKAEENYLKAISYGKKSDKPKFAYFERINLARVYMAVDRESEAITTLEDVLDFYIAKNDAKQIASAYGLLGQIAMNKNDLPKAIEHYERSLEYNLVEGSNLMIANGYTNMAIASFYKEELEKAEQYFLLAMSYREKTGNHFFISESEHNLGSFYQAIDKHDKAIIHFNNALKIAQKGGIKSAISDAYEGLAEVYESQENFKKQADFLKSQIEIDRTIFNEKSSKELSLLRISYQNEREQIKALNRKREQVLESRMNKVYSAWDIWIWIFVGCLLLLVVVLFLKRNSKADPLN